MDIKNGNVFICKKKYIRLFGDDVPKGFKMRIFKKLDYKNFKAKVIDKKNTSYKDEVKVSSITLRKHFKKINNKIKKL